MSNLPYELVDRICGFLSLDDLINTLTVSRSFQYASEYASGAYTEFELTQDNEDTFLSLYNIRRWSYLRHVRFRTYIPPYEKDKQQNEAEGDGDSTTHRCRESLQELREKDELFTKQINFVFRTMQAAENQVQPIENQVSAGKLQLTIYTPTREVYASCPHRKNMSWRLQLLNPDSLPKLTSIHALCLEDEKIVYPLEEDRSLLKIDLRILIDLAVKLPYLEFLGCKLNAGSGWTTDISSDTSRHYLYDWAGPHRDTRHNFAKALKTATLPQTLRQAQLDFLHPLFEAERIDQTEKVPNLVAPAPYDPFSFSLRSLSYQLRKLELKLVADATLFWPTSVSANGTSTPPWPNLESVCILFHVSSPSGRWYFGGPHGEGLETEGYEVPDSGASYPPLSDTSSDRSWDEDFSENGLDTSTITVRKFRVCPNNEVLVPFLTAFAKAASSPNSMPALREACLWAPLTWDWDADDMGSDSDDSDDFDATEHIALWPDRPLAWGIAYVAPHTFGLHAFPGEHYAQVRQLWWMTAQWRPDEHLRGLFQRIGDEDIELKEYWGHERYGQKLPLRGMFEQFEIFGRRCPESRWPVKGDKG
ncbi:MAG: hypothetical protein Q9160_007776 [Pyrenula sp. 1 TL-2023]